MRREWSLEFSDRLAANSADVWCHAATMQGVNRELMPLIRMTYPASAAAADLAQAPIGEFLFQSWILAGGFLPVDRHHLRLTRVDPGRGFVEESVSWTQRYWRHERSVEPAPGGCVVVDRLTFRPRFPWAAPVLVPVIRRLFQHRHARLRNIFGVPAQEVD